MQAPNLMEGMEDVINILNDLHILKNYTNIVQDNPNIMKANKNARVLKSFDTKGRFKQFHVAYTSKGFGYSFNTANFWDIYKKTSYNHNFAQIMRPKGYEESPSTSNDDETLLSTYPMKGILFPDGSNFELTTVIQNDETNVDEDITVILHDPLSVADSSLSKISVKPGYVTTILINPLQVYTDPEATKHFSQEDRACRFHFESQDLDLFKDYHQSACHFECLLKIGYNACHCLPWNFPHFKNGLPICNAFGAKCFDKILKVMIHNIKMSGK